ncbi:MAG: radical SAM protein [Candidatus Thermoplasmatota archaeon]|nr:radical SAM protein [Candidatus Thermoplasmatota archaeon]
MTEAISRIAFGPVPSRRLGQSIGVNNIPPKKCSYSCIYCQIGKTYDVQITRTPFYKPKEILRCVQQKLQAAKKKGELIDYLTFVADGEPTLDRNLGEEITLLKKLGLKIAVITNSSLIWKNDVQDDLSHADWVSLKIDTVNQGIWERINRPHHSLKLQKILKGISDFSQSYTGNLTTETMLLRGLTDGAEELIQVAEFIGTISPEKSYLSLPTRPPAEHWVQPASEKQIHHAFQIFTEQGIDVEYLIDYEGNRFASTGDITEDLLGIMSVHPLREDAVKILLSKANRRWDLITTLLQENKIIQIEYSGKKFYMRTLPKPTDTC